MQGQNVAKNDGLGHPLMNKKEEEFHLGRHFFASLQDDVSG